MSDDIEIDVRIEPGEDGRIILNTVVGAGAREARRRDVYFTIRRVAQVAGVTTGRIRQLRLEGRFPNAVLVEGTWLIPYTDVKAYLAHPDARRKDYPRQGTLSEVAEDDTDVT